MVAAGIGAGIVIVIFEVLYYKHKGWRKQQQKILKKSTDQWQECVQKRKNIPASDRFNSMNLRDVNAVEKGTQLNGISNHDENEVVTGVRNLTFENETNLSAP